LLTMTSGLDPRNLRKVAEPGTVWAYNTPAYQRLRPVLEAATGRDINALSRAWMFDTIGMTAAAEWRPRGAGTAPTGPVAADDPRSWGLRLTARGMARFGLLAQRLGRWGDAQVVPETWLREAWTPLADNPDYGYLWWLLGNAGGRGGPQA